MIPKPTADCSIEQKRSEFLSRIRMVGENQCWERLGAPRGFGYGGFYISPRHHYAHRLAYLYLVGNIPDGMYLDHICHNRKCCNPRHLRVCNKAENVRNRRVGRDNTSGYKGVSWNKSRGKWYTRIYLNNKPIFLGEFTDKEMAHRVYCEAAKKFHGAFANNGDE